MSNPFTIAFGIEPRDYISRNEQTSKIIETFTADIPSNYMFMISGTRGSGKTAMLSNISEAFEKKKDWIVIDVSPDVDILNTIAANLYSKRKLHSIFANAKIDLSGLGIGVSIENATPIYDISLAIETMIGELANKGYRVLISIDEIVSNNNIKVFAGIYQILLRKKLPIFLLMTGLYDNINNLQNEKNLTFLYRAPKIYIEPLNLFSIARSYSSILSLGDDTAKEMAKLTKGYAYAYQVLGYLYYESASKNKGKVDHSELIRSFETTLSEYVYEKIWFGLPDTEKNILTLLVKNGQMKIKDIRGELSLTDSQMSVYRDRLKRRGLVDATSYGLLSLSLPRFAEIVSFWVD